MNSLIFYRCVIMQTILLTFIGTAVHIIYLYGLILYSILYFYIIPFILNFFTFYSLRQHTYI
jgi:hypothetical protein